MDSGQGFVQRYKEGQPHFPIHEAMKFSNTSKHKFDARGRGVGLSAIGKLAERMEASLSITSVINLNQYPQRGVEGEKLIHYWEPAFDKEVILFYKAGLERSKC